MKQCRLVCLGIAISAIGACEGKSGVVRRLEDYNAGSKSVVFGKCERLKLAEENGNDDGEGLSYFYNGRYHSQYMSYVSFTVCEDGCGSCESDKTYVTDLADFAEANIEYVGEYCNACSAQCRRRMEDEEERDEEDEEDEENMNMNMEVDCSSCGKQCQAVEGGLTDEVNYLECQEAYEDDDGLQIYSGLTCDKQGDLVIGTFYDDECTVRHSTEDYGGFTYETFHTVQSFCYHADYAMSGAIYPDVITCQAATVIDDAGRDDAKKLCRIFKDNELSKFHKTRRVPLGAIFGVLLALTFCCTCGSYTYFIRHREKPSSPLADTDHDVTARADNNSEPTPLQTPGTSGVVA